jgi:large subunit ribosomal protein L25
VADVLNVTKRESRGSRNAKRSRSEGKIPAVLYGHGEENLTIMVAKDELDLAIRSGIQVVDLQGELDENAFIRDVQWDALGSNVIHVDFTRVVAGEMIRVTVNVELRGEAPGSKQGGVVIQSLHEIEIECPVMSIPERLQVTINALQIGDTVTAGQVELPEGATLVSEPDANVVVCTEAAVEEEDESAATAVAGEPEVIGRKDEEDSEAES